MALPAGMRRCYSGAVAPAQLVLLLAWAPRAGGFIEELFSQAFGGGGGFPDGFFHGGGGAVPAGPKWPRGYSDTISSEFNFLKGTEWMWNDAAKVKFEKDGNFEAPTDDCSSGGCRWSASKGKVNILFGDLGLYELQLRGRMPAAQSQAELQGKHMEGRRVSDGGACEATFVRIFDHEAADLNKDLYQILGLTEDAEEAEIKKVYRKLSVKYHPDKNPDEESKKMFAEIRDAYEVLNDPEKKILYDTGGLEAVKQAEKGEVRRGEDEDAKLEVSLEDLYAGSLRRVKVQRRVVCRGCQKQPGSPKCKGCDRCPNEVRMINRQVGPGMFIQQEQEVRSKEKCKQEDSVLNVQIERGMRDGESIPQLRMGDQRPGMVPGNINFHLVLTKHSKFERRGNDLHTTMEVSLLNALLGWEEHLVHLDGHRVELRTNSVTKPLQVMKVAGEGMPLRDDPASFGDLYVKISVAFPQKLSAKSKEAFAEVFEVMDGDSRGEL